MKNLRNDVQGSGGFPNTLSGLMRRSLSFSDPWLNHPGPAIDRANLPPPAQQHASARGILPAEALSRRETQKPVKSRLCLSLPDSVRNRVRPQSCYRFTHTVTVWRPH